MGFTNELEGFHPGYLVRIYCPKPNFLGILFYKEYTGTKQIQDTEAQQNHTTKPFNMEQNL